MVGNTLTMDLFYYHHFFLSLSLQGVLDVGVCERMIDTRIDRTKAEFYREGWTRPQAKSAATRPMALAP